MLLCISALLLRCPIASGTFLFAFVIVSCVCSANPISGLARVFMIVTSTITSSIFTVSLDFSHELVLTLLLRPSVRFLARLATVLVPGEVFVTRASSPWRAHSYWYGDLW